DAEIRADRLGGIERDRQGKKESARGGLQGGVRRRQMLADEILERSLAVEKRVGHVNAHLAGAIALVQTADALEDRGRVRESGVELAHRYAMIAVPNEARTMR